MKKAKDVARCIYERMSDGFVPLVKSYLQEDIDIPKEKYVSCSIGIARATGSSTELINEALMKADEALYYIKRTTKHNFIVWEDINEESK
ncbi:MAG: diguanylate cyclase [Lachnospiraceae bacterium]|nr:diguanylate cyclase [Lachnospiraceae bacterium]